MKKETQMYKDITGLIGRRCNELGLLFDITRIESNLTAQGIPDMSVCINGKEFWIECKFEDFEISPMQQSWLVRRALAGSKLFLIRLINGIYYCYQFTKTEGVPTLLVSSSLAMIMDRMLQEVL